MPYIKQVWKDAPSTETSINASRLNHLETQYEQALADLSPLTVGLTHEDGRVIYVDDDGNIPDQRSAHPAIGVVAVGYDIRAEGGQGVVYGRNHILTGGEQVVFGQGVTLDSGSNWLVFSDGADFTGAGSGYIYMGSPSYPTWRGTVLGDRNVIDSSPSLAVGSDNEVGGTGLAFGHHNFSLNSAVVVGTGNTADNSQSGSLVVGIDNASTDGGSVVFGKGNTALHGTLVVGENNTAAGADIVFGRSNTGGGGSSVIFGRNNVGTSSSGVILGIGNQSDSGALTVGESNDAKEGGTAIGRSVTVNRGGVGLGANIDAEGGIAVGNGVLAYMTSIAFGDTATAGAYDEGTDELLAGHALALGNQARALHGRSTALGNDVETTAEDQLAIGKVHIEVQPVDTIPDLPDAGPGRIYMDGGKLYLATSSGRKEIGGGGGGGTTRATVTKNAANGNTSVSMDSDTFTLISLQASAACRVRAYRSTADRTADAARAAGTPPTEQGLCLFEYIFDGPHTFWSTGFKSFLPAGVPTCYLAVEGPADLTFTIER